MWCWSSFHELISHLGFFREILNSGCLLIIEVRLFKFLLLLSYRRSSHILSADPHQLYDYDFQIFSSILWIFINCFFWYKEVFKKICSAKYKIQSLAYARQTLCHWNISPTQKFLILMQSNLFFLLLLVLLISYPWNHFQMFTFFFNLAIYVFF